MTIAGLVEGDDGNTVNKIILVPQTYACLNLCSIDGSPFEERRSMASVFKRASLVCMVSVLWFHSAVFAQSSSGPLWTAGKYYGGYPTREKFFTRGVTFRISPDKITMKDINIAFPADCYDENGVPSPRAIRFSQSGIEPITLRRTSSTQTFHFAYLDDFNLNWNTTLKVTWSRENQRFKIVVNTLTDTVENTYCKSNAIVAQGRGGARKGALAH